MQVLVATDGSMEREAAALFATALAGEDGSTMVATVVQVPRRLVHDLRGQYGDQAPVSVDSDAEYVGAPTSGAELERGWPGDDAIVDRYLGDKRVEHCRPIAEAIRTLGGEAETTVREGDDIAEDILAIAEEISADVIIVGAKGLNAFQGLLGSVGSKLTRRSPVPVLVLR